MKLNKQAKDRIQKAIAQAEEKTSGEIVPVFLQQSDTYPAAHLRSGLVFSSLALIFVSFISHEKKEDLWFLYAHLGGFVLGYALASIKRFKRLFTWRSEMETEVKQRMVEVFLEHNLHHTTERTGVLIFVSLFERRAEILADKGINQLVETKTWEHMMAELLKNLRKGETTEGLVQAICACGQVLKKHFPATQKTTNQLPNDLVTETLPNSSIPSS